MYHLHETLSDLDFLQVPRHIHFGIRDNGFHGNAHICLEADWFQHSVQHFTHIIRQVETNTEINEIETTCYRGDKTETSCNKLT